MADELTARVGQYTRVAAPGTVLVKNTRGILHRVLIPGTYEGTIKFDDVATAAGTAATTEIFSIGVPTTTFPAPPLEVGLRFRHGLVYTATGTPVLTFVWD